MLHTQWPPFRRSCPRVEVDAFCTEEDDVRERHSMVIELSADGLRLERPVVGMPRSRLIQLEFEVPGVDEIVWASGHICFDEVRRRRPGNGLGLGHLVRRSGIRLIAAAERHKRLLREYVYDNYNSARRRDDSEWIGRAACYRS